MLVDPLTIYPSRTTNARLDARRPQDPGTKGLALNARRDARAVLSMLVALLPALASAEPAGYRALLIGVSGYPSLLASARRVSPRNDVALMKGVLQERGVPAAAIRVLADGLPGAAFPTRQAIFDELDNLAASAKAGEQVVVYFAGHGSRQPASPDDAEPDGMAEILLPHDVAPWPAAPATAARSVHNAITARDLRSRIDRIGARGAAVWVILDACHSVGLVRGGADDEHGPDDDGPRPRRVAPVDLGLPTSVVPVPATRRTALPPAPPPGAVYFYAAQQNEPTYELRLPTNTPGAQRHGLFTFLLAQTLSGGAGMSYRQLAQAVLNTMRSYQDDASATPVFAGNALDEPVLGRVAPPVRQWMLRRDGERTVLAAGVLAGVHAGAVLALLADPTQPTDRHLGHVQVQQPGLSSATLVPLAHGGRPAPEPQVLRQAAVARMVQPAPHRGVAAAVDLAGCASPCPYTAAFERLRRDPPPGIDWTGQKGAADLRWVAVGPRLWLLPASTGGRPCTSGSADTREQCSLALARRAPSVQALPSATEATVTAAVRDATTAAARAIDLLRRAAIAPEGISTEVSFVRGGVPLPYRGSELPTLGDGDRIVVRWRNHGVVAVDVTALYVDSRHGIETKFPPPAASNRLQPGDEQTIEIGLSTKQTEGIEQLVLISVPTRRHEERADFSSLGQPALPSVQTLRSGPADAGDGAGMRIVAWRLER